MKPGRKPVPTALKRIQGNPGKRAYNHDEPEPPEGVPSCPEHLNLAAREEWDRLVLVLHEMGVVTLVDRAALAAYCQCYGRWVEAEEKLRATPILLKTATGYVQQSPWLSISNKQLELMGRYMTELGLTPASRSRVAAYTDVAKSPEIVFITRYTEKDGERIDIPMYNQKPALVGERSNAGPAVIHLDEDDLNL
jgi:P27 family predicted phage terminase small subunit